MLFELLVELEHVDARPDGHRAVHEVDLVDLVHQLAVDHDAAAERDGAVAETGAAGSRDDRNPMAVGEARPPRRPLGRSSGGSPRRGSARPNGAPGTGRTRAERSRGLVGADPLVVADDRFELLDDVVVDGGLERGPGHGSIPAESASSSNRSRTPMFASSPAALSGRSDQGQALISVSTSSSAALLRRRLDISAVISGFSIGRPPPPPLQ